MSPRIERIEDAGPDRRARRLVFADGTEPRVTSAAALKALCISLANDVDIAGLEASLAEVEPPLAKDRALRLLGYRDRSVAELKRKLADDGYPPGVVAVVMARLLELDLVDDERFALCWARTRTAARVGPRRVRRELADKGVDPELIDQALSDLQGHDAQVASASLLLRGPTPTDRKGRDRLVRRLLAKGFDLGAAYEAVREMGPDSASSPEK